jgi:hypothetical protein
MFVHCKKCDKIYSTFDANHITTYRYRVDTIYETKEEELQALIDTQFFCPLDIRHEIQVVFYKDSSTDEERTKMSMYFRKATYTRDQRELSYINLLHLTAAQLIRVRSIFSEISI